MFNLYPYENVNDLNLDFILKHVKGLIAHVQTIDGWINEHEADYKELLAFKNAIEAGNFTPSMYNAMTQWIETHLFDLVGEMIKFITVSVNDAGYIVLTFPSQWKSIKFNTTGLDIETPLQPDYGHLTISY